MTNFLQRNYHELLLKYRKFSNRLDKKISNGSFWKLSNSKRALLLKRVEQLRKKLALLETSLGKTVVAGTAAIALSAMPAIAQPWVENANKNFFSNTGQNKLTTNVYLPAPAIINLDGDSDKDLVVGSYYGDVVYYKNVGTSSSPDLQLVTGTNDPFASISASASYFSRPAFADLDNDGDFDLLLATSQSLSLFVNTGTSSAPVFTQLTGTLDPFASYDFTQSSLISPQFVDIDGDGDKDLFVGQNTGSVRYFENTGTGTSSISSFAEKTGTNNPLNSVYGSNDPSPAFTDIDGDGDFDAFLVANGGLLYYKNGGSASAPQFTQQTGTQNPLDGYAPGSGLMPAFTDVDADGDQDFIYGRGNSIITIKNTGTVSNPAFDFPLQLGEDTNINFVDLDNDGDLDMTIGNDNTYGIRYFKNSGTSSSPNWKEVTGSNNPLYAVYVNAYGSPTFFDLDGDGDLDLVTGQDGGEVRYYKNTGTKSAADFQYITGVGLDVINLGDEIVPFLVDIDNDGDADIFAGDEDDGFIQFLENTGTSSAPSFTQVTGSDNPFDTLDYYRTKPVFADVDGDGDFDLVLGVSGYGASSYDNQILYFKNTGTKSAASFVYQTGTNNPFGSVAVGYTPAPALADVDGDGDLDLYVADYYGTITFFENQKVLASVNVTDLSSEVNVYPNPASSAVTVKLGSSFNGEVQVEVLNMFGEVVSTSSIVSGSEMNISVENLAAGVYFVKVVNGTQTGTKKIVKK